jgi:hypothetical protein
LLEFILAIQIHSIFYTKDSINQMHLIGSYDTPLRAEPIKALLIKKSMDWMICSVELCHLIDEPKDDGRSYKPLPQQILNQELTLASATNIKSTIFNIETVI